MELNGLLHRATCLASVCPDRTYNSQALRIRQLRRGNNREYSLLDPLNVIAKILG